MRNWLRRRWRLVSLLAASAVTLALAAPHARAWWELRQGREALARHYPEEAAAHLERCLRTWPDSAEARLLACRAARKLDDHEAAETHLRACRKAQGRSSPEAVREWALLQASGGDFREVEEYLHRLVERDPRLGPAVWEAMAEGYLRVYRLLDASACLHHWLKRDPDNPRALELRAEAHRQSRANQKAADDYRRLLEIDPARDRARWALAICLLDTGGYQEAAELLAQLRKKRGDDPELLVRLARCEVMLGRDEEAAKLLDAALEVRPKDGPALRARGHVALMQRDPAAALPWLRRATEAMPDDYQSHWLLFQALSQLGRREEADEALRRAEAVRDRADRLGELRSRKMSEQPLDPALHVEMGVLLLRSGQDSLGENWLLSALRLDADYKPAHAALAAYYRKKGDAKRAEEHARRAGQTP